jgi:uncharacterized protein YjbI with pentapeptide repeats
MKKKYLIERWNVEPQLKLLLNKIIELFKIGGKFQVETIPVEVIEGTFDLRGINANDRKIIGCEFRNINFSFSSFDNTWIENSFFEKCLFDKVDFSDSSDHRNYFKECIFSACKFNYAAIGYDGTKFVNCIFENCKFTKTIFNRPEFVDVFFKNSQIKNIDFNASSFEHCSFEGELKDVWFRGGFPLHSDIEHFGKPKKNEMKNVSFENAELEDLTFSDDCDLSTVKIKNSYKYYKYDRWKERLEFLKSESQNWNDREKKETEIFVNACLGHAKNQEWYIINRNDIERYFGKDIALKIMNQLNSYE